MGGRLRTHRRTSNRTRDIWNAAAFGASPTNWGDADANSSAERVLPSEFLQCRVAQTYSVIRFLSEYRHCKTEHDATHDLLEHPKLARPKRQPLPLRWVCESPPGVSLSKLSSALCRIGRESGFSRYTPLLLVLERFEEGVKRLDRVLAKEGPDVERSFRPAQGIAGYAFLEWTAWAAARLGLRMNERSGTSGPQRTSVASSIFSRNQSVITENVAITFAHSSELHVSIG